MKRAPKKTALLSEDGIAAGPFAGKASPGKTAENGEREGENEKPVQTRMMTPDTEMVTENVEPPEAGSSRKRRSTMASAGGGPLTT